MFEIFLIFLAIILIFFNPTGMIDGSNFWIALFGVFLLVILVLPGVYSMLTGAPFVPTCKKNIGTMMKFGNFTRNDKVAELGCGDGRIIRKIAKKGVKSAKGYEFSFPTYCVAVFLKFLTRGKEKIYFKNFWNQDYSDVDVIICFLLDNSMKKFEKLIWPCLKSGTRVLANEIGMPNIRCMKKENGVYFYVKND